MSTLIRLRTFAALAMAFVVIAALHLPASARSEPMDEMSIDMDIAGNDPVSLGPRNDCISVSPGAAITIDVTATNIRESNPMLAFTFTLNSPFGVVTVKEADPDFLLNSLPGSSLLDASDPRPDDDGVFVGSAVDVSATAREVGSGVLDRVTLALSPASPAGLYELFLTEAAHIDPANDGFAPKVLNNAFIAVDSPCAGLPIPTPTPGPPPPPANDNSGNAAMIDAMPFEDIVDTNGATLQVGEPAPCGSIGATVWYSYTAQADGRVIARTRGSAQDTVLAAYVGTSPDDLVPLACNDDSGGIAAQITLEASAGQTVLFQAGGFEGLTGPLVFRVGPHLWPGGAIGIDHDGGSADINAGPAFVLPLGDAAISLVLTPPPPALYTWDLGVRYDTTQLEFLSCNMAQISGFCYESSGAVQVSAGGYPPLASMMSVMEIQFRAIGDGGPCTDLTIEPGSFSDPQGYEWAPGISNGRICISSRPTPVPTGTPVPTPPPVATPTPSPTSAPGSTPIALPRTGGRR